MATESLAKIFNGKKEKWLPLYRRLLARLSRIHGIEVKVSARVIRLGKNSTLQVKPQGLEIVFKRTTPKRLTHKVLLSEASAIDEEFISWVKASHVPARKAKRRST